MTSSGHGAPRVDPGARPRVGSPSGRPRWSLVAMGVGAAMLVATGVAACQAEPPADVGAATVTAMATASAAPTGPGITRSGVPVQDGGLPSADPVEPPVKLVIPAMRLNATVAAVGVDARTGEFDVPPSVDRVGWYRFGPGVEATAGSIVVAGHVDSAAQGKGAFFALGKLAKGERITVAGADGVDRVFTVVARERYAKTKIPLEKYFARNGKVRLTLITCGGPFDARTGHYRDNVVVTAAPV